MKKLIVLAGALLLGIGSAFAQQGKQALGVNLSYGTEIESIGLGAKYQYNITDQIRLEPSLDYFFKNDGLSMFDINLNAHYLVPVSSGVKIYPLAGFTYTNWHVDLGDIAGLSVGASESRVGVNLGAGAEFDVSSNLALSFELKYQLISDVDQAVLGIGLAYKF